MSTYELWTDGSIYPNPGFGGWAFVIRRQGNEKHHWEEYGMYSTKTTNNEMEFLPMIFGLRRLSEEKVRNVVIFTDSQFIMNVITKDWSCVNPKIEQMKRLFRILEKRFKSIRVEHVRGHSGIELNELCNALAEKGRKMNPAVKG